MLRFSLACGHALAFAMIAVPGWAETEEGPTRQEAADALRRAAGFFREQVADHGGYVWRVSGDLKTREGEGKAPSGTNWVQPPGTPTVGEAYLDAFEATGDPFYKEAAHETAMALVRGQLQSGGWAYRIESNPDVRARNLYRIGPEGDLVPDPTPKEARRDPGGWDVWKTRKNKGNISILDDDSTQAATRFLIRIDRTLDFQDKAISEAVQYALDSLRRSQYPNGGWSQYYDRFPEVSPSPEQYPVKPASYPETWSWTWPRDHDWCYVINDNVISDLIATFLLAHEVYGNSEDLDTARKAGDFLILAQMPEPQPAWAQQYNRDMHPTWARKFEPPAVTGGESQGVLRALLALYRRTGDDRYLKPIPAALAYFERSKLPDGRLARFYELETNRPLYFTKDYQLTDDDSDMPTHYAFIINSRLDSIANEYERLQKSGPTDTDPKNRKRSKPRLSADLKARAQAAIETLDDRGAWVTKGQLRAHDLTPDSGIIDSWTFVRNVATLSRFLEASAD